MIANSSQCQFMASLQGKVSIAFTLRDFTLHWVPGYLMMFLGIDCCFISRLTMNCWTAQSVFSVLCVWLQVLFSSLILSSIYALLSLNFQIKSIWLEKVLWKSNIIPTVVQSYFDIALPQNRFHSFKLLVKWGILANSATLPLYVCSV